jgi:hypothetical protein
MTATLILSETSIDYLRFMYGRRPNAWVEGLIIVGCAAVIAVCFALVYIRTRALRKSLSDTAEPTRLELRSIKVATVGTVVLAIVGSWLAVSLARVPEGMLTGPNIGVVVGVLILVLALPTVVSTAICYSVASTGGPTGWSRPAR